MQYHYMRMTQMPFTKGTLFLLGESIHNVFWMRVEIKKKKVR